MNRMEKIIAALDEPERYLRAKFLFALMEEERKAGVEAFVGYTMLGLLAISNIKLVERIREKLPEGVSHQVGKAFEAIEKEDQEARKKAMEAKILAEEEAKKAKGKSK